MIGGMGRGAVRVRFGRYLRGRIRRATFDIPGAHGDQAGRGVETPNGYHIVTEPFNYNDLETDVEYELKTDGMLFVEYLSVARSFVQ